MPKLPPKPCSKPGCSAYAKTLGRCDKHQRDVYDIQPKPWGTTTASRQARGYGKQWQKTRRSALGRDSFLCVLCKAAGRMTAATDVDHIKPKSEGGDDSFENLQSLCGECHKKKTQADNRRARKNIFKEGGW